MRFNFKKISAIATSVLLTGMTLGVAAAANYPAPFVSGSTADVAIVWGSGAGVSALDGVQASNIQEDLQDELPTGAVSVSGGESFKLEKSDKFNFNNALNAIYSSLDKDELPKFLADGTYDDGDVDEDYDQKITLDNELLSLFADTDYNAKEPTVGFMWENNEEILRYEIEFDNVVNYTEMVDTDMPLLGKEYYVLAASSSQIDVLDSAEKQTVAYGDTVTLDGHTVSISYIDETDVKITVDGETTGKLSDNEYEELSDGSYVVANEVLYDAKESGTSKAVISIGAGKIELITGEDIEVNGEDVDGLQTVITDSTGLSKIEIVWKSNRDSFLTEENSLTMPLFEAISLSYGGLEYDGDSETISIENGETLKVNTGNDGDLGSVEVLWYNGTEAFLGQDGNELVIATSDISNVTWTTPNLDTVSGNVLGNISGGLDLEETDRFIVTRIDEDLSDTETMYFEVKSIENDSGVIEVQLDDLVGNNDIVFDDVLDSDETGDITVTLVAVNGTVSGRAYINFSAGGDTLTYNKIVSEKGMIITIPTDAATTAVNGTGAVLALTEADKDEDVSQGYTMTVTIKNTTNEELHVQTHNLTDYDQEESDNVYIGIIPSDLASTFTFDKSNDEYEFELEYTGMETVADVRVIAGGEATASTNPLGDIVIKDSEVSSMSGKNLIVVGGSCINSVAANILGGSLCGPAFTSSTGIGSGQFLIKSVESPYNAAKVALLVAGYEVDDTVAASTYLRTQSVDTSVGKAYKGTSATSAELIVE